VGALSLIRVRIRMGPRVLWAAAGMALIGVGFGLPVVVAGTAAAGDKAKAQGDVVTVYSSLPLNGASRPQAVAIVRGARLALEERGGTAGEHPVRYVSLNDATARAGAWTPERTVQNARRAFSDPSVMGYIGEFNSGASAVSMPLLSEAGIAQISPSNTYVGLTRGGPGAERGEPEKFYPRVRHYFRLVTNDRVQAAALATAMRDRGCRRIASVADRELYGAGVGVLTRRHARRLGLRIVVTETVRWRYPVVRVGRIARARPDCVAYTGITANGAVPVFIDLGRRLRRARFFGSDGLAEAGFTDPREGGIPRRLARRVVLTVATLAPGAYPPAGRAFFERYAQRYGDPHPDPYAIYGYEAMQLVLDAVSAVGADRSAVIRWLRSVTDRPSVLGTYGFDRFGDTTLNSYGLYRIRRGALVYADTVDTSRERFAQSSRGAGAVRARYGAE
jgi:branched-chain amino acid transport system substrate-binding protein